MSLNPPSGGDSHREMGDLEICSSTDHPIEFHVQAKFVTLARKSIPLNPLLRPNQAKVIVLNGISKEIIT